MDCLAIKKASTPAKGNDDEMTHTFCTEATSGFDTTISKRQGLRAAYTCFCFWFFQNYIGFYLSLFSNHRPSCQLLTLFGMGDFMYVKGMGGGKFTPCLKSTKMARRA